MSRQSQPFAPGAVFLLVDLPPRETFAKNPQGPSPPGWRLSRMTNQMPKARSEPQNTAIPIHIAQNCPSVIQCIVKASSSGLLA